MKELEKKTTYLKDYDITVNQYLTTDEIQAIINAVNQFDAWGDRESNIIMLVMHFATDISDAELEKVGINAVVESGLWEEVRGEVRNVYDIYSGLDYTNSINRQLTLLAKKLPDIIKPLEEVLKKHGKLNSVAAK